MALFSFSRLPLGASNSSPKYNVGDSLFEWVVSVYSKKLQRIRKSNMIITDTIDISANTYNVVYGTPNGVSYVYIGSSDSTKLSRFVSSSDNPGSTRLDYTITMSTGAIAPYTVNNMYSRFIAYNNGYLWTIPSIYNYTNTGTYIARIKMDNDVVPTTFNFNTTTNTTDSRLTIYNISPSVIYNVSKIYIYGNYIYNLYNTGANSSRILKFTISQGPTSGIFTPVYNELVYSLTGITEIASDNVSTIWMSKDSTISGIIYTMSINFNTSIIENSPMTGIVNTITPGLKSIYSMIYGAGYLWVSGINITTQTPQILRINVLKNTIDMTIPLITTPYISYISSMEIYNEYLWIVDYGQNASLLKMKIFIPCFKEGTKILCLNPQLKEEYIPIQQIRKGHLVKTYSNGFVPVAMIGKSHISNPGTKERIKNSLYKCSRENYAELFEDLYITGCHSILVDDLTDEQYDKTVDALGQIYKTEGKYRLMAYLDENAEPYEYSGTETIWHFALENADYYMNYGVYANGLLVESTSKRYMKELSGMELIDG